MKINSWYLLFENCDKIKRIPYDYRIKRLQIENCKGPILIEYNPTLEVVWVKNSNVLFENISYYYQNSRMVS